MTAVDVIHSFWVPNFGQKMDAVPGIETTILVTPTRTGEFAVVCTELCGLGHATMRAKARVVTQAEFDDVDAGAASVTATAARPRRTQYPAHFEPPHGPTWKLVFGPGLVRGAWMAGARLRPRDAPRHRPALVVGLGCRLEHRGHPRRSARWSCAPIGFLAGIGSFDYWLHYISGRPTRPEDHSGHGAHTWKDYFRVNTDHKVIGDPVPGHDVRLLHDRRAHGDALPRRARAAGAPVRRLADVQRPRLGARDADDLPLHHPGVRRPRELRRAADARRARTWPSRA